MAFRTNYRFERAERDRAKKVKKEEKLKKRQERDAVPSAAANDPEETPTEPNPEQPSGQWVPK